MIKRFISNLLRAEQQATEGLAHTIRRSPFDFVLGDGNIDISYTRKSGQWLDALPVYEKQNRGYETYTCVLQSATNCIETHLKAITGEDFNFSDRALARAALVHLGKGTSFIKAAQAITDIGLVDETLYPFDGALNWKEFFAELPMSVIEAGGAWKSRYKYSYQWVESGKLSTEQITKALTKGPVQTSLQYSSRKNAQGFYSNYTMAANHAVVIVGYEYGKYWYVLDSYDPFLKKYTWDSTFRSGMQHFVQLRTHMELYMVIGSKSVYAEDARGVLYPISNEQTYRKGLAMGLWDTWDDATTITQQAFYKKEKADVSFSL